MVLAKAHRLSHWSPKKLTAILTPAKGSKTCRIACEMTLHILSANYQL